jgi:hypothetical protein
MPPNILIFRCSAGDFEPPEPQRHEAATTETVMAIGYLSKERVFVVAEASNAK